MCDCPTCQTSMQVCLPVTLCKKNTAHISRQAGAMFHPEKTNKTKDREKSGPGLGLAVDNMGWQFSKKEAGIIARHISLNCLHLEQKRVIESLCFSKQVIFIYIAPL